MCLHMHLTGARRGGTADGASGPPHVMVVVWMIWQAAHVLHGVCTYGSEMGKGFDNISLPPAPLQPLGC
jgi:hypothetical protein